MPTVIIQKSMNPSKVRNIPVRQIGQLLSIIPQISGAPISVDSMTTLFNNRMGGKFTKEGYSIGQQKFLTITYLQHFVDLIVPDLLNLPDPRIPMWMKSKFCATSQYIQILGTQALWRSQHSSKESHKAHFRRIKVMRKFISN